MLGIVDLDFQRSDRLQDALDRHGIVAFVVNTASDHGSRSLITAAESLIVATSLLGEVLSLRCELGEGSRSDEDGDIVMPFTDFAGCPYQVVVRTSVGNWRPDWRLFRARLGLEPGPTLCSTPAHSLELKLAS